MTHRPRKPHETRPGTTAAPRAARKSSPRSIATAVTKATRESAPAVGSTRSGNTGAGSSDVHHVVIGDRGRLVLPAAIRAELGLDAGSRLLLSTDPDGSLRLRPYRAVADAGRGLLADLGSGSMVDELLEERRIAAEAEAEAAGA